jgi:ADP-heptose:LPS heptosyltransferase
MASNKNFLNINYQLSQNLKGKILIIGIGGGSDIVGAYALGKILQQNNPNARISVAVAVTPKSTYKGFDCIEENLYRANVREDVDLTKLHHTLSLIKQMSNFDSQFYLMFWRDQNIRRAQIFLITKMRYQRQLKIL